MPDRILDLTSGLTMVVTDLHGDKAAFARYVGRFLQLRSRKKVNRLLLMGDLIHTHDENAPDDSLEMIQDVIRMQRTLPKNEVIVLLGNHELPHLYGVTLSKGSRDFTPKFERELTSSGKRDEILAFLDSLPFYIRTASGVMFTHAGPNGNVMANIDTIRNYDHQAILSEFDHALSLNPHPEQLRWLYGQAMGMPYEMLARYYLAVSGKDDPRYDDLVRAYMISQESKEFELLWDALFTRCEEGTPLVLYERMLATFLDKLSLGAPAPQRFIVTGHMNVEGGHTVVTPQQLRVASATHAQPREAGQYLLIDFGTPMESMDKLIDTLGSVF